MMKFASPEGTPSPIKEAGSTARQRTLNVNPLAGACPASALHRSMDFLATGEYLVAAGGPLRPLPPCEPCQVNSREAMWCGLGFRAFTDYQLALVSRLQQVLGQRWPLLPACQTGAGSHHADANVRFGALLTPGT